MTDAHDDAELVGAAQAGDIVGLGLLLDRHHASLFAAALRMLGSREPAEDAVQETFVRALERIQQVRDPAAVGGLLHAILRNVCRMQWRRRSEEPIGNSLQEIEARLQGPSLEEGIEALAARDWVWTALADLPEALRVTAMLRYFGPEASYAEIAAILGVPVGTVRSRLHEVKVRLAEALLRTAELSHDATRIHAEAETQRWSLAWDEFNRGIGYDRLLECFAGSPEWLFADGSAVRGLEWFADQAEGDLHSGTRIHLSGLTPSPGLLVMESRYENPPDDPFRCPPGLTWVFFYRGDVVERARLYFAPRPQTEARIRTHSEGAPA